jgi:hypothetical protein
MLTHHSLHTFQSKDQLCMSLEPPIYLAQIGREFSERLALAHEARCPWRTAACDASLAHFPPLERSAVLRTFRSRAAAIGRLNALPPISQEAYDCINSSRRCAALLANRPVHLSGNHL